MSQARHSEGIGEEDYFILKILKVISTEARITLFTILYWGCHKDPTESFEDYAKNKLQMSINVFDKHFDKMMKKKMRDNLKGDEFDVTLLYACVNHLCPDISTSDKTALLKPIKNFRNDIIHNANITDETMMIKKIDKLHHMLIEALEKAAIVYRKEERLDEIKAQMEENISNIKDSPLLIPDIDTYRKQVLESREARGLLIQEKGLPSLKSSYTNLSNVDPAAWISGKERLNIKMVYVRLDIILKHTDKNTSYSVSHDELLQLKTNKGEKPTVIVVEGEAGSGKSTLAKFILAEWAKPSLQSIRGLEEYDLVLYVECRNRHVSSFLELIQYSMPQVSYLLTDQDFRYSVLQKKTLVVVDGLDEMNENSEKLLQEMLQDCTFKEGNKFQFIITTRPLKMTTVFKLCKNLSIVHTKTKGIPSERRIEFVKKLHEEMKKEMLHEEMKKEKISKQDTDLLVDYIKQSQCQLGEHYRLPLNLALLTYLWDNDPERVNSVTSATSLYVAVLNLLKLRVISKLDKNNPDIDSFLEVLFDVYLDTHKSMSLQLSEECQAKLHKKCKDLCLDFNAVCGAFFSVENEWTPTGPKFYLFAPHKSIMEFFGAHRIYNCLSEDSDEKLQEELENLRKRYPNKKIDLEISEDHKTFKVILGKILSMDDELKSVDLPHYQNVLIHLAGLMALWNSDSLHRHGSELIDVLETSEVEDSKWLDLVAEAECDPQFTTLIANQIEWTRLVIRDGHCSAALEMFKTLETNIPVEVILQTEVKQIPKIVELMEELSKRDCTVELLLNNHWKNPENGFSTEHLKKLAKKQCKIIRFVGNLDDLATLPESVEDVKLTIADDNQANKICCDIQNLDQLLSLQYLGVHIKKGVSSQVLKPLPAVKPVKKESGTIWLSNVSDNDINETCAVIKALSTKDLKFQSLMFPRCQLSLEKFQDLVNKLKMEGIKVSKTIKTDTKNFECQYQDEIKLRCLIKDALGCEFSCGDESTVW